MDVMQEILKDKTILIVEDDPVSQAFLNEVLSARGAQLIFATSGEEAVLKFESNGQIHLVLMDIRLPGQNGYETTKILKSMNPSVPIIAQTAYALEGDREKALRAGCDEYVSKPIKPFEFLKKISEFL